MSELARRLKDVVDARYEGKASKASRAAGLNENAVLKVLENPRHQSTLDTLDRMAQAYDWDLCDVVYWALDRPRPSADELPLLQQVNQLLAHHGYSEVHRQFIREVLERVTPAPVPRSESR